MEIYLYLVLVVLLRNLSEHLYDEDNALEIYELSNILNDLDINMDQFIDVCILSKTDYTPTALDGIGCGKAYAGVKKYKSASRFLKKTDAYYEDSFPEEMQRAQRLFKNPPSKDYIFDISLVKKSCSELFGSSKIREIIDSYYC